MDEESIEEKESGIRTRPEVITGERERVDKRERERERESSSLPVLRGTAAYDTKPVVILVLFSDWLERIASWKRNCVCTKEK